MDPTVTQTRARRRAVSGFTLYDVANSAFVTTVITAVGGPFITGLAVAAADADGRFSLLGLEPRATAVYAYATSFSVLIQVLILPLLGALADRGEMKRRLLIWGTALGVLATFGLALVPAGAASLAVLALVVANVAFGSAILAYNAFLADVALPEDRDRVSARGFAAGYAGGAVMLVLALGLIQLAEPLGLSRGAAVRVAIALAGLWWAGVGALAIRRLGAVRELVPQPAAHPPLAEQLRGTFRELRGSLRALRRLPHTARYLVAFLLFNDAIQAVVALSAVVLTQELFVAKGLEAESATPFLLQLILLIQVVAVVGAAGSARLAERIGGKQTLLLTLVVWSGVVVYAVAALDSIPAAYVMGGVIALVLGGSQSLARSLFSKMVPDSRQASFFGFYELAERGTAWVGTLVFAVVLDVTGSYRGALLSLLVLFVLGGALLARTDVDAGIEAAQAEDALEGRTQPDAA